MLSWSLKCGIIKGILWFCYAKQKSRNQHIPCMFSFLGFWLGISNKRGSKMGSSHFKMSTGIKTFYRKYISSIFFPKSRLLCFTVKDFTTQWPFKELTNSVGYHYPSWNIFKGNSKQELFCILSVYQWFVTRWEINAVYWQFMNVEDRKKWKSDKSGAQKERFMTSLSLMFKLINIMCISKGVLSGYHCFRFSIHFYNHGENSHNL